MRIPSKKTAMIFIVGIAAAAVFARTPPTSQYINPDVGEQTDMDIIRDPHARPTPATLPTLVIVSPIDAKDVAQQASCVLQVIVADNADFKADAMTVAAILNSDSLRADAIKRAIGTSASEQVRIQAYSTATQTVCLSVVLLHGGNQFAADAAQRLLTTLSDSLRGAIQQAIDRQVAQLNLQIDTAKKQDADVSKQIEKVRQRVQADRDAVDPYGWETSNVGGVVQEFEQEKNAWEKELAQYRMTMAGYGSPATLPSDAWQEAVDLRRERVKNLTDAHANDQQIAQAQADLAEASARLASAREIDRREGNASDERYRMDAQKGMKQQIAVTLVKIQDIDTQLSRIRSPMFTKSLEDIADSQDEIQRLINSKNELRNRIDWAAARIPQTPVVINTIPKLN